MLWAALAVLNLSAGIVLTSPFTYVYDGSGEKIRTLQFKGAGLLTPNSLFFTKDGRLLVTPGCFEFRIPR